MQALVRMTWEDRLQDRFQMLESYNVRIKHLLTYLFALEIKNKKVVIVVVLNAFAVQTDAQSQLLRLG